MSWFRIFLSAIICTGILLPLSMFCSWWPSVWWAMWLLDIAICLTVIYGVNWIACLLKNRQHAHQAVKSCFSNEEEHPL